MFTPVEQTAIFVEPSCWLEIHLPKSEWPLLYLLDSNMALSDKVVYKEIKVFPSPVDAHLGWKFLS